MSDVVALVKVDEQQIVEGGIYDSDDPRVVRNPQWFSSSQIEKQDTETGEWTDETPAETTTADAAGIEVALAEEE